MAPPIPWPLHPVERLVATDSLTCHPPVHQIGGSTLSGGRKPIDLNSLSASQYVGPPIRQADQQSSMLQARKGVPQPTPLPGAPMATVDPAMGLGPPPSYESSMHGSRVGTACTVIRKHLL